MRFTLFSKVHIQVTDPIALVECYCFQSDFYKNYDLLAPRTLEDVNRIGARIDNLTLEKCKPIINQANVLPLLKYKDNLDGFLKLEDHMISEYAQQLFDKIIRHLIEIPGIGIPKATKLLHTIYPGIIPMIDNPYIGAYCRSYGISLDEDKSGQIFSDYYLNLKLADNLKNLSELHDRFCLNNLLNLTKVRIFDIIWWSYLKSKAVEKDLRVNNPSFHWSMWQD